MEDFDKIKKQASAGARYIPVYFETVLPDLDVFSLLEGLPGERAFYFQRSGEAGPQQSYIGLRPFARICVKNESVEYEHNGETKTLLLEAREAIALMIGRYGAVQQADLPFFMGGAFGYLSYDFVRHIEPILKKTAGNLSDAKRLGGAIDADLMLFDQLFVLDHLQGRFFIVSGIVLEHETPEAELFKLYQAALEKIENLKTLLANSAQGMSKEQRKKNKASQAPELAPGNMQSSLGQKAFISGVQKLKSHIRAGDIFQAVISEKFKFTLISKPLRVFETLTEISPSPYQFYFFNGQKACFGSSPEMLLQVSGRRLETHPIAGTRPRGDTPASDSRFEGQLKRSSKEKAEHLMLVDLARNDLGRISKPASVKVESYMQVQRFASVMHLVSRVTGQLREGRTAVDALFACFPAGTLSGAPKVRAMELISQIETEARGFYGGAMVALGFSGDLDSCIAIRSLEVDDGIATLQAGAGIVADSKPEREYQEVLDKSRALRRAIAITEAETQHVSELVVLSGELVS
jgi:anthranilate synthase component 1